MSCITNSVRWFSKQIKIAYRHLTVIFCKWVIFLLSASETNDNSTDESGPDTVREERNSEDGYLEPRQIQGKIYQVLLN